MKELYGKLMDMCEGVSTPFYFTDQHDSYGNHYRIFSYHSAIPSDFVNADMLEARGIMFAVVEYQGCVVPLRIAARPMQKFFNHNEHGVYRVASLEEKNLKHVFSKMDGSLISSYIASTWEEFPPYAIVCLKSKGSISSEHAVAAMAWLREREQDAALSAVEMLEEAGWTVNMEWVSPEPKFRIVVHYDEPKLVVLNARSRNTGEYMERGLLERAFADTTMEVATELARHDIERRVAELKLAEGYVCIDNDGNWVKLKSPWYLERHRAKDFINRPLAFVTMVIKGEIDDVLGLLKDQFAVYAQAEDWMYAVTRKMNAVINTVTKFYRNNHSLDRKSFAILAQSAMTNIEFALAMQFYTRGAEPDWNAMFLKWVKKLDWGIPQLEVASEKG